LRRKYPDHDLEHVALTLQLQHSCGDHARSATISCIIVDTQYYRMAKANEHGRLIAAAAKAALAPLGCKRKGQSRLWHSDQRFWVLSVEFEPSGWSKGSYLKVGVSWLWRKPNVRGLDFAERIADFVPFETTEQFKPRIEQMAALAAQRVLKLRKQLRSLREVHRWLMQDAIRDGRPIYNAAIAAALVGDAAGARQLFERMERWPTYSYDSQLQLKADSAELAALLPTPERFRSAILDLIERKRAQIGFPSDTNCLQQANPTILRLHT
jgi:hypothetical protein